MAGKKALPAQPPARPEGEAMPEIPLPENTENEQKADETSFGCVFCLTGKEKRVAEDIEDACPEVRAITMRRVKYRTHNKVKSKEEELVLPSYIFFKAPSYFEPLLHFPRQNIIKVLTLHDGSWQLIGEDEKFVKWLFEYDGMLGVSQAYQEGTRIKVVSGPLKDMEGKISKVDKRGLSGQVILNFYGKDIPVWLAFELVDVVK